MRRSICYIEPNFARAGSIGTWEFVYTTASDLPKHTTIKFDLLSQGRPFDWQIPQTKLKNKSNLIWGQMPAGQTVAAKMPAKSLSEFEFTLPSPIKAGDNFTIWHDPGTGWVQIATRTDSTYASGYVGMVSHNTSMAFDDFGIVSPMVGFPGFGILDEFNRADGALGSNWSVEEGTVAIATNKVTASTTESAALWFQTFTNCEAYMTLSTTAVDETVTLFLRATTDQGYAVTFTSGAVEQTINIYARHDGWTDTTLVGTDTIAIANAGDKIGARVSDTTSGSTITVFYDSGNGWQEIFSEIDTNYASGKVGFGINENAAGVPVTTLDDFGGGGVATYGPGVTEPNIGRHRTPGIGIVYNPQGIGIR